MSTYRVSYHVHVHRDREDRSLVMAELRKHWWAPGHDARIRTVAQAPMLVAPSDPEAVVLADVLVELSKALKDELYRL